MITLRKFTAADCNEIVVYLNDPDITKFITSAIPIPYSVDDALWWVNKGSYLSNAKAIEVNGKLVGCISAKVGDFEYSKSAELGYWVAKRFWGNGYATKSIELYCDELFSTTELTRLFVSVVDENYGSIRVLEKNNFKFEGRLKNASFKEGVYFNEIVMAKLKS